MSLTDILLTDVPSEIISNYDNVVGKLTLFNEHLSKNDSQKSNILERPVTPIEDEIINAPSTLEGFLSLFRRRIYIDKTDGLSEQDQLSLLGIVEREICLIWPQLVSFVHYPFFDDAQNKELRRSLFISIILKCKTSFEKYREKFQCYSDKAIFSDEANLVRVKLQLAEDVKKKLHLPSLRRHMFENVSKGIFIEGPKCCAVPSIEKLDKKFQVEIHDTSRRQIIEISSQTAEISPTKSVQKQESDAIIYTANSINEKEIERQRINDSVTSITKEKNDSIQEAIDRRKFIDDDLRKLLEDADTRDADDAISADQDSQESSSIKYYKSVNEQLQKKIDALVKRNEIMSEKETFVPRKPLVEQPFSVPRYFNKMVYFVSDIRPTPRRNDCDISLTTHGPLWNELADEITPEIVKLLDSNLSRGEEVKDIYREMMKTVSHEHLSYTQDPLFEKCPPKVNVQEILSSSTLSSDLKKERIINPDLRSLVEAPWKSESKTRADWEQPNYANVGSTSSDMDLKHFVELSKNNLQQQKYLNRGSYGGSLISEFNSSRDTRSLPLDNYKDPATSSRDTPIKIIARRDFVLASEKFAQGLSKMPRLMQDRLVKQYDEWLLSWTNTFDISDYSKFLSLQPTDFLSVIFHHFDETEGENDENDDVYVSPEILEQRHRLKEREMERNALVQQRVQELERDKNHFSPGLWNPSSIFIGGLGKTPTMSDEEIKEVLKDKPQIENPDERLSKMSAYSRARSAVANSKPLPLFTKQHKAEATEHRTNIDDHLSLIQTRLERIWTSLKMPSHLRLDMTIKYSSGVSLNYIDTALSQWELATNLVVERESALSDLEKFERVASDPNRFFVKGYRGSSNARLEESKKRTDLQKILDDISLKAQKAIDIVKIACGDEITYAGRLYVDKIKWDRTEMLYWLQEERKESCSKNLNNSVYIK